jgi:hypothetical protein
MLFIGTVDFAVGVLAFSVRCAAPENAVPHRRRPTVVISKTSNRAMIESSRILSIQSNNNICLRFFSDSHSPPKALSIEFSPKPAYHAAFQRGALSSRSAGNAVIEVVLRIFI